MMIHSFPEHIMTHTMLFPEKAMGVISFDPMMSLGEYIGRNT